MSLQQARGNDPIGLYADQAGNDAGLEGVMTDKQVLTLVKLGMVAQKALFSNCDDSRRIIG